MTQIRKLEAEVEIESSGELFYEWFTNAPHQLLNLQPEVYKRCDLLEGQFGKTGFVVQWTYNIEGKSYMMKEKFEILDKKNKILKLIALEGDVMDAYKSFEVMVRVVTNDKGVDIVKWCLEYEKIHQDMADPHGHLEAAIQVTKKMDKRLSSH